MKTIKVAVGQFCSKLLDTDANFAEACRLSLHAVENGARLILLPEGCLTGNAFSFAKQAVIEKEDVRFGLLQEIADLHGIAICAGFAMACDGDRVNIVHAIVQPEERPLFQHKSYRACSEPEFLIAWPDDTRTLFEVDGFCVTLVICSEYGQPGIQAQVDRVKPDLVLFPSAGSLREEEIVFDNQANATGEGQEHIVRNYRQILDGRARTYGEMGMTHLIANPVGFDGETYWPGNSFIIERNGTVHAWIEGEHRPDYMKADVGFGVVSK